jgi:hypothetical protein
MAARKTLTQVPASLHDAFNEYARHNVSYGDDTPEDPRVQRELMSHFEVAPHDNSVVEHNRMATNLRVFELRLWAKINQLFDNLTWSERGPCETDEDFQKSPRTLMKLFQELLVHPSERVVFDQYDGDDLNNVEALVIDPQFITDTLLRNLGLNEFTGEGWKEANGKSRISRVDRMELKAHAVERVREMLSHLEPVGLPPELDSPGGRQLRYLRLFRITGGVNEGSVLGTVNIDNDYVPTRSGDVSLYEPTKILFKTDIHAAERRLMHIEAGYKEEAKKLKFIQTALKSIRSNLRTLMKSGNRGFLFELRRFLPKIVESLEFVRDTDKEALKRELAECLNVTEYDEVYARLGHGVGLVGRRFDSIHKISRYLAHDRQVVRELIAEEEIPMMGSPAEQQPDYTGEIRGFLPRVEKVLEGVSEPADRDVAIRHLNDLAEEASALRFEPYRSFGIKFSDQVARTLALMTTPLDDRDGVPDDQVSREFLKVYLIAKMARSYKELIDLYFDASVNGEIVDPLVLKSRLAQTKIQLLKREGLALAEDIDIPEYDLAYRELFALCDQIHGLLSELDERDGVIPYPFKSVDESEASSPEVDDSPREERSHRSRRSRVPRLDELLNGFKDRLRRKRRNVRERLSGWVDKVRDRVKEVILGTSPVDPESEDFSSTPSPSNSAPTDEDRHRVFSQVKTLIGDFSFVELVNGLDKIDEAVVA